MKQTQSPGGLATDTTPSLKAVLRLTSRQFGFSGTSGAAARAVPGVSSKAKSENVKKSLSRFFVNIVASFLV
jgi:hypothetical protein